VDLIDKLLKLYCDDFVMILMTKKKTKSKKRSLK